MRQRSKIASPASPGPDSFEGGAFVDLNQEIVHLREDTSRKEEAGRKTRMVVKYPEFRIALITMNAGSKWDDHRTSSRILVQVLRGQIRFCTPNNTFELCAGQLLALDPGVIHRVDALQESAFLLTLSDAASRPAPATA
jgi:quercetin dioxygenase-like cupin family protein